MCNTSRVSIASLEPSCVLPSQRAPSPGLPLSASHPAGESFVTRTKQKSFSSASRYLLGASPQPGVHGPLAVTWRLSTPHHSQSTHTHTHHRLEPTWTALCSVCFDMIFQSPDSSQCGLVAPIKTLLTFYLAFYLSLPYSPLAFHLVESKTCVLFICYCCRALKNVLHVYCNSAINPTWSRFTKVLSSWCSSSPPGLARLQSSFMSHCVKAKLPDQKLISFCSFLPSPATVSIPFSARAPLSSTEQWLLALFSHPSCSFCLFSLFLILADSFIYSFNI